MKTDPRFFELLDHVGIDADGQLEPLVHVPIQKVVPTMQDGQVAFVRQTVLLKPVGAGEHDRRVVATTDPVVAEHLLDAGLWREIDPTTPVQKRLRTKLLAQEA